MKKYIILYFILIISTLYSCENNKLTPPLELSEDTLTSLSHEINNGFNNIYDKTLKPFILNKYANSSETAWGQDLNGIITNIPSTEKVLYLTFDACGSTKGNQIDRELINFLISENIPSTLFINERWIDNNLEYFKELSKNPLFQIENHGTSHKPLSINGRSAYGIEGTKNLSELYDEVNINSKKIEALTGRKPKYFRSGTAFYDDVAVKIIKDMGYKIAGYNVLGDAGATFNKTQIINQFQNFQSGSIFLFHMNHPESETFEGLEVVIPRLKNEGWIFKTLPN
ncbi:MAG: polysaccharide deacetylase family protein [Clostridium sp.]